MGVLQYHGTSNTPLPIGLPSLIYYDHNYKSLPDQTYNDTVAMKIGSKPVLSPRPLMRF